MLLVLPVLADCTAATLTGTAGPPAARNTAAPVTSASAAVLASAADIPRAQPGKEVVILATTTSTQDSGLLDVLVPMFEKQTGYRVKTSADGTGQALALGERAGALLPEGRIRPASRQD
jgi:ABC-type tungstate transport system permease subunit